MSQSSWKVRAWVAAITILAGVALQQGWQMGTIYPGLWALSSFVLVAFLLERTGNDLRFAARGSTSFVVHIAGGLLFGPFWGGVIAAVSTLLSQAYEHKPLQKALFNTTQRVVCVSGGLVLVRSLGGDLPLFGLGLGGSFAPSSIQRDLWYFLFFAGFYFAFNTVSVSGAIALSTGNRFSEVWNFSAKGVLGYDLGASLISIALAWLYIQFETWVGIGAVGLVVTLAPILVIRHIYGLYRKLQNSGRELLDLMVKAIEARDPYTSGHSVRVATLAKSIAQETKMSAEEVEEVYTAAILHDVGKIHEEFAPLLRKDSKLTPEETALLQTHAVKSAELVAIISSFQGTILNAVRSHHERWDGGGYPDGLAGEDIPLGARIIMISDTTDAMTTDRPYRKRLPIEAVVSELLKYRGSQFDPRLVDLVVNSVTIRRVMSELQAVHSQAADVETQSGGSKRVQPRSAAILRNRSSWPRIKAF
jgi:putative nucleotidyltransferase with HDIG domain